MKNRKLTSENLAEFLNFMKEVEIEYSTALSMMKKCENLECDLLHQLEIEKLSVSDKNKLATKLRDCLRDRRYYKNIVEEDAPLANIIGDVDIKKTVHRLEQVLGQIRKAESYHDNRKYYPRIMKYEEYKNIWKNIKVSKRAVKIMFLCTFLIF